MIERWKNFRNTIYDISNYGKVKNTVRGTLKTLQDDGKGYLRVQLSINDGYKNFRVHRLVMEVFKGLCPLEYDIHHLDEDKKNNRLDNLEYRLKVDHHSGETNGNTKLTWKQVEEIRTLGEEGDLHIREIAKLFGVSTGPVMAIINRRGWKR